ncbi:MAG TPA: AAA family ATPase [Candidatus Limnocylindrales bacterium]|nr:AAA family ATPase [Candidatus Limnocylindrales bacterium]
MKRAGSILCPVIVGRDDVLELLDEAVAETVKNRGRTLFLSGQAGLGKTRLMRAAVRKAEAAGIRVDGGAVAPQDLQVPLASIREFATGLRSDPNWGTLSADLLAIDGKHDGDSLGSRRLIVRAVADRILQEIDRPTMLVFPDLHWADEMSLEVIGELARHVEGRPLFIMGDYRADEFPTDARALHREWRARLLSQRIAEEVRLRPLTLQETGVATTLILGGELPAPKDVVSAVHDRTNGIPLHIEELLGALDDESRASGRLIREAHVPDTIGDAVLARLAQLSDDARAVARAGAVVGRCFTPDVLSGLMERPMAELEPTLAELVDASILRPFNYVDEGYYDFRHQLLRDAIYGDVPPSQLRRYHGRAAEFVMQLEASSVVHASRHYERAGLRPEAFQTAMTAAREASRMSARHEAFELYQRAVANMPSELPLEEQADIIARYGEAANAIEQNEEAVIAAKRARALYQQAGMPAQAADMLTLMATGPARDGSPTTRVHELNLQALAEVEALPPSREVALTRSLILSMTANDHLLLSEFEDSRRDLELSHAIAEQLGERELVLENELTKARLDIVQGRYETGLRDGLRAARDARDAGYESVGVTGYRNLAIMAARIMDRQTAEMALGEGLQYADAIEQSHCRQMIATTTALLDWAVGAWDAADDRARHELVDRGCVRGTIGSLDVVGLVALGRGRLAEARRWLDESLATGRGIDEVAYILTPLWGLAEVDLAGGDAAAAIGRCEEAWSLAAARQERALLIPFVVTGTRALLAARRPEEAERWLVQVRDHLAGWEPVAGAALSHAEGLLRLAAGSTGVAREALERAVRGWEDRSRIWESTWARLDLAHCLMRANRFADATVQLAAVRTIADRIGSLPLHARAEELARQARGRGVEDEPWRPLTTREFEVARLIADGMTNAEIAEALEIAPKTASSHVEHILAKLGVTRRAEIAAWAATVARSGAPGAGRPALEGTAAGV